MGALPHTPSSAESLPEKPRGSRWRRYSLRALLLFQVVIAVFVGYVILRVRSIEQQHVTAMDLELPHFRDTPFHESRPVWPVWFWEPVCRFCGSQHASDVITHAVQTRPLKLSDVEQLPYLESLSLHLGVENDQVLERLARSKYLKVLEIVDTAKKSITDENLVCLKHNNSITFLGLSCPGITDKSVVELAEMPNPLD